MNAADELRGAARRRRALVPRTERRVELLDPGPVRIGVVAGHDIGVVEDAVLFESVSARRLDARVQRGELKAGVISTHGAGHDFGHAAIVNGGPGAESVLQVPGSRYAHVARDHAGLGFHDAVQVRDAGDRVDQPGWPVVAEVVLEDPPYRIDPFPGLRGRVVDGNQDLHPYGLLPEIDAGFGEGLFVVLV